MTLDVIVKELSVQECLEQARGAIRKKRLESANYLLDTARDYMLRNGGLVPEYYRLKRELCRRDSSEGLTRGEFRKAAVNMLQTDKGKQVRDLTKTLSRFQTGVIDSSFGVEFLRDFLKPGLPVLEEELRKYELELDTSMCNEDDSNGFKNASYDGIFNLCITYNAELIAHLGFGPDPGVAFTLQIQGVKGAALLLNSFMWTSALVQWTVQFARQYGIPAVEIQSVDNNLYATSTFASIKKKGLYPGSVRTFEDAKRLSVEEDSRIRKAALAECYVSLTPRQGFLLYDATAAGLGFVRMPNGNYVKEVCKA